MTSLLLTVLLAAQSEPRWTVYFQEDCLPCRKQLRELDCFVRQGWNIQVIGVGQSRLRLHHELKRLTQSDLAFEFKTWEEARELGVQGTPSHQRWSRDGKLERLNGLLTCEKS
ncbi:MAG: hypothetical protein M3Q07_04235 [Pseudobdellovibrionaceae bacterium]|nr:hypothetical protein [Pseudobdellovibrionaceae bacterium]